MYPKCNFDSHSNLQYGSYHRRPGGRLGGAPKLCNAQIQPYSLLLDPFSNTTSMTNCCIMNPFSLFS